MTAAGISLLSAHELSESSDADGSLTVLAQHGRKHSGFDTLIWATGRAEQRPGPGADWRVVRDRGEVLVDDFQNTNVEACSRWAT